MADFPRTVPLLADGVEEEWIPPEFRIAQSVSHKEARDAWGSAFRRKWTFNLRVLGTTAASDIVDFYQAMLGPVVAFNFTSPRDGGTYLCRFESTTLPMSYQGPGTVGASDGFWPAKVSIIEVL